MKLKLRHLLLFAPVVAVGFYFGYGEVAKAWPAPYYTGYFSNSYDTAGVDVFPPDSDSPGCSASGGNSVPSYIDTAAELISWVECKLNSPNNYGPYVNLERVGAAFLIQTMRGGFSRSWPTGADIADWETRVNYYASRGWIYWFNSFGYTFNTYYQGTYNSSSPNDDAFYPDNSSATSIVFSDGAGNVYGIRRQCGNPVGTSLPGLAQPWSAQGRTTVSNGVTSGGNITVQPGATLTFNHYILNNGPGVGDIWYDTPARSDVTVPWTAQYYNNMTLSGSPVLTRSEQDISYIDNSGGLSPGPGVIADGFSARWTRTQNFPAGTYLIRMKVDDGGRFYIDGNLVLDAWIAQGATPYSINYNLGAGTHTFELDYYEQGGPGWATLDYTNYYAVGGTDSGYYSSGQEKLVNTDSFVVPGNATPGTEYCRRVLWDWRNSYGSGEWGLGTSGLAEMACATVIADYNLNPTVTPSQTTAQDGDNVTFTYKIQNTGSTASPGAQCYNKDGSGAMVGTAFTCSGSQVFSAGSTVTVGTENVVITNQTPGSTVCRTLYIQPSTPSVGNRASTASCVVIAKTPYVRFGGNDVWAGGGYISANPSCNTSAKITTMGRALTESTTSPYAGSYYNNMTLSGTPVLVRSDPTVNFNWGSGSPGPGVNADNFSVRWARTDTFVAGLYTLSTTADDGVRVYVDGVLYIDHWIDESPTTYTTTVNLTAGTHTVVMEYYENAVGAVAQLSLTPNSSPATQYAGSSVEYGAFALNQITGFGSAGKVLVGSGTLGSSPRSFTFANNEADPTKLGYYGAAQHCLTDYAALYASATPLAAGTYDVGTRGSGVWRAASGNLHLYGTMPAGATQIYIGVNDLFIDNDIKYPASYANGAAIPSLVVITTHNLAVMSNVKQLDGFYVAQGDGVTSGMFRDCWPKTSPQAVGDACDVNQLVVNGAVAAGKLELWRSYGGSGATVSARQTPAEIFNFSPELYIRNALSNTNTPLVQVVNTVELPPRF